MKVVLYIYYTNYICLILIIYNNTVTCCKNFRWYYCSKTHSTLFHSFPMPPQLLSLGKNGFQKWFFFVTCAIFSQTRNKWKTLHFIYFPEERPHYKFNSRSWHFFLLKYRAIILNHLIVILLSISKRRKFKFYHL